MKQERLYRILLSPVVSEKAVGPAGTTNQVVFKVVKDAQKSEIKVAIEQLFDVKVEGVRTLNVKGKTKRTKFGIGKRSDWKKAYIKLAEGHDIDFAAGV
jgi:large subunit ribosomal protein L23